MAHVGALLSPLPPSLAHILVFFFSCYHSHKKTSNMASPALTSTSASPNEFKWELPSDAARRTVYKAEHTKAGAVRPSGLSGAARLTLVHYATPDWSGLHSTLRGVAETAVAGDSPFWTAFDAALPAAPDALPSRVAGVLSLFEAALTRAYGVVFNDKLGYSSTSFELSPRALPLLKLGPSADGTTAPPSTRVKVVTNLLQETCEAFGAEPGTKPWMTTWYYLKSVKLVIGKGGSATAYIDCVVLGFAKGDAPPTFSSGAAGAPVAFQRSSVPDDAADAAAMC